MGLVAMFPGFGIDSDRTLPMWWDRFYAFKNPYDEGTWRSLFTSLVSVRASSLLTAIEVVGDKEVVDSYSRYSQLASYWLSTLPMGDSSSLDLREIVHLMWDLTAMTDLGILILTGSTEKEIRVAEDMAKFILVEPQSTYISLGDVDQYLKLLLWDPREMQDALRWSQKWSVESFTKVIANEQARRVSTVAELYKPLGFSRSYGKNVKNLPWG